MAKSKKKTNVKDNLQKYQIGEKVIVDCNPWYRARILDFEVDAAGDPCYFVHYINFPNNKDEWVGANLVYEHNEINLKKMRAIAEAAKAAKKTPKKTPNKTPNKSGRRSKSVKVEVETPEATPTAKRKLSAKVSSPNKKLKPTPCPPSKRRGSKKSKAFQEQLDDSPEENSVNDTLPAPASEELCQNDNAENEKNSEGPLEELEHSVNENGMDEKSAGSPEELDHAQNGTTNGETSVVSPKQLERSQNDESNNLAEEEIEEIIIFTPEKKVTSPKQNGEMTAATPEVLVDSSNDEIIVLSPDEFPDCSGNEMNQFEERNSEQENGNILDITDDGTDTSVKEILNIQIPQSIKDWLLTDRNLINKGLLVQLPCTTTAEKIMQLYLINQKEMLDNDGYCISQMIAKCILSTFDDFFPSNLYSKEVPQYEEMKNRFPSKRPSEIYGGHHLIRSILITKPDHYAEFPVVRSKFEELLVYIAENFLSLLHVNDYVQ